MGMLNSLCLGLASSSSLSELRASKPPMSMTPSNRCCLNRCAIWSMPMSGSLRFVPSSLPPRVHHESTFNQPSSSTWSWSRPGQPL